MAMTLGQAAALDGACGGAVDVRSRARGGSCARSAYIDTIVSAAREWSGFGSLLACTSGLITFLAVRYGVSALAVVRTVVALYALGVVPGHLLQRYVLDLRPATPLQGMLSSLLLGTFFTPLIWYTLCVLGLGMAFYPLALTAAVIALLNCGRHHDLVGRLKRLVAPEEAPLLWLGLGLAVLWSWKLDLVAIAGDQVVILPHNDHMVHTSMVAELARGVPPATVPFIAFANKWAYHQMPNVWCDMIRRVAGLDARDAYFHLALPLRYALLTSACYLGLVRRFGNRAAILGAVCVLGFVGYSQSQYIGTNWLLTYLYWNTPAAFGLMGLFLICYYASMAEVGRTRQVTLIASILSVLLLWYKANFALAVAPAVAVWCVIVLARRRRFAWIGVCLAAQAALFAVRMIDVSSADFGAKLVFEPFRFIGFLWWEGGVWLRDLAASGVLSVPVELLSKIRYHVDVLPGVLRWPTMFVLCMVFLFHMGIAVAIYARVRCGFGRLRPQARSLDLLFLLVLAFCGLGFIFFPVHDALVWNVPKHVFAVVYALLFALMGPVLCDVYERLRGQTPLRGGVVAVVLVALFVANGYELARKAFGPVSDVQEVIGRGEYDCLRHIEATAPPDAVVLRPEFENGLMTAAMLTQRRVAIEWACVWATCCDTSRIVADLRGFYAGTEPGGAHDILQRYDVTHVVADRAFLKRMRYGAFLREDFRSGQTAVFTAIRKGGQ
ncbi:MAG: hypothetical protein JXQ73_25705 [Phycisphaerae bacterium]|nr:hypothetical protein [Phycisphaerae bacterium]